MDNRLNQISVFKKLDKEPQEFWVNLINKYMVDKKYVVVRMNCLYTAGVTCI